MASRQADLMTKNGKKYTGYSSQGIRYPLVPLWDSNNEVVVHKWRFQNTIFGHFCLNLFWKKLRVKDAGLGRERPVPFPA